jgi:hypothetical protein
MVICATVHVCRVFRIVQGVGNACGYSVCATLKGGASQGAAPMFAPLRHLRHPLYRGGQGGAAHTHTQPPWLNQQKAPNFAGGVR